MEAINRFVDGYNRQDYKEMRSTFSWIFRRIFSEKTLREIYGTQYRMFGPARLVNVRQKSERSSMLELGYGIDTSEHLNLGLVFTKKNKVIGLGSRNNEKYEFPLVVPPARTPAELERLTVRLDSLMQAKYKQGSFNGCVSVIENGQPIFEKCYGYADFKTRAPLNRQTVFELASVSKQFTAMGIMMLAEQGKLQYTDDVRQYIPGFPYKDVTIEHLLTHTGGLREYEEVMEKHWDRTRIAGNADVVAQISRYKLKRAFKPGTKHEYSNTGYVMLAVIIERISGLSYGAFLDKNIFQPLGMTHSRVYNTRRAGETIPNYAWGYVRQDKNYALPDSVADYNYVYYLDGITGDGTVNSTLEDLAKWEKGLRDNRLVSAETLKKAHSAYVLKDGTSVPYGYGWEVQTNPKFAPAVYHSGGWPGYSTFILHMNDRPTSVIVLSNNDYIFTARLTNRLARIVMK